MPGMESAQTQADTAACIPVSDSKRLPCDLLRHTDGTGARPLQVPGVSLHPSLLWLVTLGVSEG